MGIIGALDVHRKQLTFDYVDTTPGEVSRGRIAPGDRPTLRTWLARFAGVDDVEFVLEAGTGWRYVVDELVRAGARAVLAEPADTAALRGRRRHAKTDRSDSKLMREALQAGRIPQCYIPPAHVLECRALLATYADLRREHTAWIQRIRAVLFHQGVPALWAGGELGTQAGRVRAAAVATPHLTSAGRMQFDVAISMLDSIEIHLFEVRRELLRRARQLHGARLLQQTIYGVGPITALALVCWLGGAKRFSSSRKAVRFAGLDITVRSSDSKRSPGRLSRQGPSVLRWCLYEAGKASARTTAPDHGYYATVKDRKNGKRAALSQARRIVRYACHLLTALGDDAFTVTTHTSPARSTARRTARPLAPLHDDMKAAA